MEQFYQVQLLDANGLIVFETKFALAELEKARLYKNNWLNRNSNYNAIIYKVQREIVL